MNISQLEDDLSEHSFTDDRVLKRSESLGKAFQSRGVSPSQFRKLYNQIRSLSRGASSVDTKELRSRLRVFRAQVAYSVGRDQIPEDLKGFLDTSLEKILDSGDDLADQLRDFVQFLESVYGYYYYHEKS